MATETKTISLKDLDNMPDSKGFSGTNTEVDLKKENDNGQQQSGTGDTGTGAGDGKTTPPADPNDPINKSTVDPPASGTPADGKTDGDGKPDGTEGGEGDGDGDQGAVVGEEDVQQQLEFFEAVNKLHGLDVKVDYGNVLPSSEEGIYLREKAIMEAARAAMTQEMAKTDPRGMAYLLHRQQGGTDAEFFAKPGITLPDYELFKNEVDLQRQVYRNDLVRKGIPAEEADALVKIAEQSTDPSKNLYAKSSAAYKVQQEEEQAELARLAKQMQDADRQYVQQVQSVQGMIDNAVKATDLAVVIPDTEKKGFSDYVRGLLQHDGENFYIAHKLEADSVKKLMSSLYMQYKNGDLSALVARKASTMVVGQRRVALGNSKKASNASQTPPQTGGTKKVPLGQLPFPS